LYRVCIRGCRPCNPRHQYQAMFGVMGITLGTNLSG
jgi:hypothetical protein